MKRPRSNPRPLFLRLASGRSFSPRQGGNEYASQAKPGVVLSPTRAAEKIPD